MSISVNWNNRTMNMNLSGISNFLIDRGDASFDF